ncbi:TlpA disulfide reductase family protein [Qipengyuania qiaonensis]|uniref:TlpA family protein disulfide reductase n=1 Tax=Qipengyuania qiaonensis TaxID=2867240 RepID=UPI0031EEDA78
MSRLSFTLAIVLGLAVAGCDSGAPEKAQESSTSPMPTGEIDVSEAGAAMPEFRLEDTEGNVLKRSALNTPTLLNLWATWCAPCVKEMPLLDALADEYDGRLKVLTVSQDMQGAKAVAPFFAKGGYANLEPWLDPANDLGFAIGGGVMPTTVLYDARGTEVWRVQGEYDWSSEEARAAIDEAIGT